MNDNEYHLNREGRHCSTRVFEEDLEIDACHAIIEFFRFTRFKQQYIRFHQSGMIFRGSEDKSYG